jgi:hypothetical protein
MNAVSESQQIPCVELTFSGEKKKQGSCLGRSSFDHLLLKAYFKQLSMSTDMSVSQGLSMLLIAERDVLALTGSL